MAKTSPRLSARKRRHQRVRKRISGTTERPRLNVFRSAQHIYAQVIDDEKGITVAAASTVDKVARGEVQGKTKVEQAKVVGQLVAERSLEAGIKQVVFDRGGFIYHGRIKALADASREAGLEF
ncbi:MAG: 50S ribosomal protein L18 [Chloroflexota bacterium]